MSTSTQDAQPQPDITLGCSTLGLPALDDDELLEYAMDTLFLKAPYRLLEIHLNETLPEPHNRDRLFTDEVLTRFRRIAGAARARGATVMLGFGGRHLLGPRKHRPTLFEEDPELTELRLRLVREGLELGGEVGAKAVIFLTGPSRLAADPDKHATPEWDRMVASFERLLRVAERTGVILAPEGHSRHLFSSVGDLLKLRERVDSPLLGFTGDTVHQALVDHHRSLEEVYAEAAPHLTHVQLDYAARLPQSWDDRIVKLSLFEAPMGRQRLGDILMRVGAIDARQLQEALAAGAQEGEQLGAVLVRQGACTQAELDDALAQQDGIGTVDIDAAYRGLQKGGYQGSIAVESYVRDVPEVDPLEYCRAVGRFVASRFRMPRARSVPTLSPTLW